MKSAIPSGGDVHTRNRYGGKHGKGYSKDFLKQRDQANARERVRTRSVNVAFSSLRSLLPSTSPERKLSKIEILRMARSYISHLTSILSRLSEKLDFEPGLHLASECQHSTCNHCDHCLSPVSPTSINGTLQLEDYSNDTLDDRADAMSGERFPRLESESMSQQYPQQDTESLDQRHTDEDGQHHPFTKVNNMDYDGQSMCTDMNSYEGTEKCIVETTQHRFSNDIARQNSTGVQSHLSTVEAMRDQTHHQFSEGDPNHRDLVVLTPQASMMERQLTQKDPVFFENIGINRLSTRASESTYNAECLNQYNNEVEGIQEPCSQFMEDNIRPLNDEYEPQQEESPEKNPDLKTPGYRTVILKTVPL